MAPEHEILEISSDDEDICPSLDNSYETSIDWLSELFGAEDGESGKTDDVVVVDELSCAVAVQKQNSLFSNSTRGVSVDDSDDDCQVLDGDPDNKVAAVQDKGDESDDLLIVGEKGQLACRDYPHPRHLCAKFPFSTTPHEKHCNLCHCYVCDSLAPCLYWGSGVSSADHCHSSDTEERWKLQRKSFKKSNGATTQPQKLSHSTLSIMPPLVHAGRVTSLSIPPGPCSTVLPTPIPKSNPLRACSATSFGMPNIISQRHSGRSVTHGSIRSTQQLNRRPAMVPGMHCSTRDRHSSSGGDALGRQGFPAFPIFKRTGSSKGSFVSLNANRQQNGGTNGIQMNTTIIRKNRYTSVAKKKWQDLVCGLESDPGVLQTSNSGVAEFQTGVTVSSQPEVYSQPSQNSASQNTDLFRSSAPVMTDSNMLDASWLNTASVNVSECISADYSAQPSNLPVVSESNPISGEDPFSWITSLEMEPASLVAKDVLPTLDHSTLVFDFENIW